MIHGTAYDEEGVPLPGISVINGGQVTTTDSIGNYRFGNLLPGSYTLRASSPCHDSQTKSVTVIVRREKRVDFTMLQRWPGACPSSAAP